MTYYPCPDCGANLDPGERCDCHNMTECQLCDLRYSSPGEGGLLNVIEPKTLKQMSLNICPSCLSGYMSLGKIKKMSPRSSVNS